MDWIRGVTGVTGQSVPCDPLQYQDANLGGIASSHCIMKSENFEPFSDLIRFRTQKIVLFDFFLKVG